MMLGGGALPPRTPPTGRPLAGGKFSSASPFGRLILIIMIIIIIIIIKIIIMIIIIIIIII